MRTLAFVDAGVLLLGLVASAAFLLSGHPSLAGGCLAGGAIASLDWFALRCLLAYLARGRGGLTVGKLLMVILIGFKFILLAGMIYFVINKLRFDPYGVAAGMGALPAGIIAGAAASMRGEGKKE